ncbi:Mucin-like protein, partial [Trichoplax sp. H2]
YDDEEDNTETSNDILSTLSPNIITSSPIYDSLQSQTSYVSAYSVDTSVSRIISLLQDILTSTITLTEIENQSATSLVISSQQVSTLITSEDLLESSLLENRQETTSMLSSTAYDDEEDNTETFNDILSTLSPNIITSSPIYDSLQSQISYVSAYSVDTSVSRIISLLQDILTSTITLTEIENQSTTSLVISSQQLSTLVTSEDQSVLSFQERPYSSEITGFSEKTLPPSLSTINIIESSIVFKDFQVKSGNVSLLTPSTSVLSSLLQDTKTLVFTPTSDIFHYSDTSSSFLVADSSMTSIPIATYSLYSSRNSPSSELRSSIQSSTDSILATSIQQSMLTMISSSTRISSYLFSDVSSLMKYPNSVKLDQVITFSTPQSEFSTVSEMYTTSTGLSLDSSFAFSLLQSEYSIVSSSYLSIFSSKTGLLSSIYSSALITPDIFSTTPIQRSELKLTSALTLDSSIKSSIEPPHDIVSTTPEFSISTTSIYYPTRFNKSSSFIDLLISAKPSLSSDLVTSISLSEYSIISLSINQSLSHSYDFISNTFLSSMPLAISSSSFSKYSMTLSSLATDLVSFHSNIISSEGSITVISTSIETSYPSTTYVVHPILLESTTIAPSTTSEVTSSRLPDIYDCSINTNLCHSKADCINTSGLYNCLCCSGFTGNGTYCADIDECAKNQHECPNRSVCINNIGSYQCQCMSGFSGNGTLCEDIDECTMNQYRCHNKSMCINIIGSYQCQCIKGFSGNGTFCEDINECVINEDRCHNRSICINNIGSYQCQCINGFSGNGKFCDDKDECALNQHGCHNRSICINTIGSYQCQCMNGFSGNGTLCEDIDECAINQHECHNRSICINNIGSYQCQCINGFSDNGTFCEDIDECALNQHGCHNKSICINNIGSYQCQCINGFSGNGTFCEDIDECLANEHRCHNRSICINNIGSYQCQCINGFSGNGTLCEDIDECVTNAHGCHNRSICINNIGSYQCQCIRGFSGNGTLCKDIDECVAIEHGCHNKSVCINNVGSYQCRCINGFLGNGTLCEDIDECVTNQHKCHNRSICINNIGSYQCQCINGFSGSGTLCEDIDECLANQHNCHSQANCINGIGSYECFCRVGYTGNGTICEDVNECKNGNRCHPNSTCHNNIGSFNCLCLTGFSGNGTHCTDVDECATNQHQCHQQAICSNILGSYECNCRSGYIGSGTSCSDINECNGLHNCSSLATCYNTAGSYYCTCNYGLQGNGIYCFREGTRLYPYGLQFGDRSFGRTDQGSLYLYLSEPIYFVQTSYRGIYISADGLVSLGFPYLGFRPRRFPRPFNRAIIAPYFADCDLRSQSLSSVYYQQYFSYQNTPIAKEIIKNATNDVQQFQQIAAQNPNNAIYGIFREVVSNFSATHVIVITWYKVVPYPFWYYWHYPPRKYNTFQLVLISNGENLFGLFNYEVNGFNWWKRTPWIRARVGYSYGVAPFYYEIPWSQRRDQNLLRIDQYRGNTGEIGKWAFRLDDPDIKHVNYARRCTRWYYAQAYSVYYRRTLPACPCRAAQAILDPRFIYNRRTGCAISRFSFPGWGWWWFWPRTYFYLWSRPPRVQQRCCYSTNRNTAGALIRSYPGGSSFTYVTRSLRQNDEEAYSACCKLSRLCYLYRIRRPIDTCRFYRPPRWSWMWGDPHVETLDGKKYSFNGVGEYTLIRSENNYFTFQGRTKRPFIANTTKLAKATIYTSFAMSKNDSDTVEVKLNENSNTIAIIINKNSTYNDSHLTNGTVLSFNNIEISKSSTTYIISFTSGISAEIQAVTETLVASVVTSSSLLGITKGLLGTYNGNVTDDFLRPDGTYLSINATDEEIYHQFGQLWQIDGNASLFTYPPGRGPGYYSDPSFVPNFSKDINSLFENNTQLRDEAVKSCNGDAACLFDAAETLSLAVAVGSKNVSESIATAQKDINIFPPTITGESIFNVTFGQVFTTVLNISDGNSNKMLELNAANLPPGASIDNETFVFTWNVTTYKNISFEFTVINSHNLSAIFKPAIFMCYCANNGTCQYDSESITINDTGYAVCQCASGWVGSFCTQDLDECAGNPCYENVTCTPMQAPATGYTCGLCPGGLQGDGVKCYDVNECETGASLCNQTCVNTVGCYSCLCNAGFELDANKFDCKDIDECSIIQPCHQICVNSFGSYSCACNHGYSLNSDNRTCSPIISCSSISNNCSQTCAVINNKIACSCNEGFNLATDQATCQDQDECTSNPTICAHNCTNTVGSYKCSCRSGYQLRADGRTCQDIDECTNITTCPLNTICTNTPGSYECQCVDGFQFIGTECEDIDECGRPELNACNRYASCVNFAGSYNCLCKSGFDGNGIVCTDINECNNINNCSGNAQCQNDIGSYRCICRNGFTGNGFTCTDINECDNLSSCRREEICYNTLSSYYCACKKGFYLDSNTNGTTHCKAGLYYVGEIKLNGRFTSDLSNKGSQAYLLLTTETVNKLNAALLADIRTQYTVRQLIITNVRPGSIVIDFSITLQPNATSVTAQFLDSVTNRSIKQIGNYPVALITFQDYDQCADPQANSCSKLQNCTKKPGTYGCTCINGYQLDLQSNNCQDIDECLVPSRCANNSICINEPGGFQCQCLDGYSGNGLTECRSLCSSNLCKNGGTCFYSNGTSLCNCSAGFDGQYCESTSVLTIPTLGIAFGIAGGVLILILTLIGVFVFYHRNKKARSKAECGKNSGNASIASSASSNSDVDDPTQHHGQHQSQRIESVISLFSEKRYRSSYYQGIRSDEQSSTDRTKRKVPKAENIDLVKNSKKKGVKEKLQRVNRN